MKKIMFTGGTGFLGRNLVPLLQKNYHVYAPTRQELNLKDDEQLVAYIKEHKFDAIIHAAIPNIAFNESDRAESLLENSLHTFAIFEKMQPYYGKMVYFGSGAEFDKNRPISMVTEEDFGMSIPKNEYGLAKYMMNLIAEKSEKIYNFRIFGCYGPTDASFKFMTSVIRDCIENRAIRLHQDCYFDFMYVTDICNVLEWFIENQPKYHSYNMCTGVSLKLSEICKMIQEQMGTDLDVIFEADGLNNEYSANNRRILAEMTGYCFTSIYEGIKKQIKYEKECVSNEKKGC